MYIFLIKELIYLGAGVTSFVFLKKYGDKSWGLFIWVCTIPFLLNILLYYVDNSVQSEDVKFPVPALLFLSDILFIALIFREICKALSGLNSVLIQRALMSADNKT